MEPTTDRAISSNKPDIINHNNKQKTWMLIDVAIPGERNVIQKEAEKIANYKGKVYPWTGNEGPERE